jgi:hypothetical protein
VIRPLKGFNPRTSESIQNNRAMQLNERVKRLVLNMSQLNPTTDRKEEEKAARQQSHHQPTTNVNPVFGWQPTDIFNEAGL